MQATAKSTPRLTGNAFGSVMSLLMMLREYFNAKPRAWWNLFDGSFDDTDVVIREAHWWRGRVDERWFTWADSEGRPSEIPMLRHELLHR